MISLSVAYHTVTMAYQNKLFVFVLLFCLTQNINCRDISDETRDRITEIIGEKQRSLRSYLEGLKFNFQGMEYEIRFGFNKAKTDLELEMDDIVNKLKTKEGHQKCATKITNEITQQSLNNYDTCFYSVKPDLSAAYSSISKYAEYITTISEVPRSCIQSHTEVDSIVHCVQTSVDEIGKEMSKDQKDIEVKIEQGKENIKGLEPSLKKCYNEVIIQFKSELEGVKSKCV